MKKFLSLLLVFVFCLSFTACGNVNNESSIAEKTEKLDINCNVFALKGPTGVGMVSLMEKNANGKANLNYKFNLVGANEEIVAKITNGEADIAAVATNVASTLYNKTKGTEKQISVLAINTLGVLCIVSKGEEIATVADLKGKTIYSTGQGANPEFIINYILEKNNLKVGKDVKVEYVSEPTELVSKVITNEKAVVVAPQPVATNITIKDKSAKIVLDLNDEWDKISETKLVMGAIVVRNKYLSENPKAVETFLKDYEASINDVNADVVTAASLCEKYEIVSPAAVAQKAIPYCNIVYQDGKELKTNLSAYLKFLFDNKPAIIGNNLPADDFYYETN